MTTNPTTPDDLLDLDDHPTNDLAADVERTLRVLADEMDAADDGPQPEGMAGLMPTSMAVDLIISIGRKWADEAPDEVVAMLARTYLETGALLDRHADVDLDADPDVVDLLDRDA